MGIICKINMELNMSYVLIITLSSLYIVSHGASIDASRGWCDGYQCGNSEKCCSVNGQHWCSPQWQSCYSKIEEPESKNSEADSSQGWCDGYQCGNSEKCCSVNGNHWCSPQWQSCYSKVEEPEANNSEADSSRGWCDGYQC